jgi:hypothetical protein
MIADQHRVRRTDPVAPMVPDWVALMPVAIVTYGGTEPPIEQLLDLQSAVARIVHLMTEIGQFRCSLPACLVKSCGSAMRRLPQIPRPG